MNSQPNNRDDLKAAKRLRCDGDCGFRTTEFKFGDRCPNCDYGNLVTDDDQDGASDPDREPGCELGTDWTDDPKRPPIGDPTGYVESLSPKAAKRRLAVAGDIILLDGQRLYVRERDRSVLSPNLGLLVVPAAAWAANDDADSFWTRRDDYEVVQ